MIRSLIGAAVLTLGGCHEVVVLPEPTFPENTQTVVWAARGAEWQLFAQDLEQPRPSFVLKEPFEVYGFGFGCGLARLQLEPGRLEDPVLPPPPVGLAWTGGDAWAPVDELPPPIVEAVPRDGQEACASFAPEPVLHVGPGLEAPSFPGFGLSALDAVYEPDGTLLVLQELVLNRAQPRRFGSRVLRLSPDARRAEMIALPEDLLLLALARRGNALVWAMEDGLVTGRLTESLSHLVPAPQLAGAVLVSIAVSPPNQPIEAFTVAHDRYPGLEARTSTITLALSRPSGSIILTQRERRFDGEWLIPEVIWTGPGEGWAIGVEDEGQVTRIESDTARSVSIHPSAGTARGIGYTPSLGVVVLDSTGKIFSRPMVHDGPSPWRVLGTSPNDGRLLRFDDVGGVPVLVTDTRSNEGALGVRLSFLQQGSLCPTETVGIQPIADLQGSGRWTVGRLDETRWWFVSGIDDRFNFHVVEMSGAPGSCSR